MNPTVHAMGENSNNHSQGAQKTGGISGLRGAACISWKTGIAARNAIATKMQHNNAAREKLIDLTSALF